MTAKRESGAGRWVAVALIALASAGAVALALRAWPAGAATMREAFAAAPLVVAGALTAPFVGAWIAALVARGGSSGARAAAAGRPRAAAVTVRAAAAAGAAPAPPADAAALQLLAVLQQEGRFVDFIEEDLAGYSDAQIGAAVRSIHEGCRSALHDRLELKPVLAAAEGATVTVERGFDPAAVRVTGNVRGEPPYRGVVRHPGWRSERVKLPERTGDHDASILAPAEVEVL